MTDSASPTPEQPAKPTLTTPSTTNIVHHISPTPHPPLVTHSRPLSPKEAAFTAHLSQSIRSNISRISLLDGFALTGSFHVSYMAFFGCVYQMPLDLDMATRAREQGKWPPPTRLIGPDYLQFLRKLEFWVGDWEEAYAKFEAYLSNSGLADVVGDREIHAPTIPCLDETSLETVAAAAAAAASAQTSAAGQTEAENDLIDWMLKYDREHAIFPPTPPQSNETSPQTKQQELQGQLPAFEFYSAFTSDQIDFESPAAETVGYRDGLPMNQAANKVMHQRQT